MTTQDSVVYWKINRAVKNRPQDNLGQLPTLAPIVIQNQHRIAFRMLYGRPGTIRFFFFRSQETLPYKYHSRFAPVPFKKKTEKSLPVDLIRSATFCKNLSLASSLNDRRSVFKRSAWHARRSLEKVGVSL